MLKKSSDKEPFWRNDFSAEEISYVLGKLREARQIDHAQQVIIHAFQPLETWISILVSATSFEARSDALKRTIIMKVMFSTKLKHDFTDDDFRRECYRVRSRLQSEGQERYYVIFPIWNKPPFLSGKAMRGATKINYDPDLKTRRFRRIASERQKLLSDWVFEEFFTDERVDDLNKCDLAEVSVCASSAEEAYELGSEYVYLQLGLANLAKDKFRLWRISDRPRGKLPVSGVLIAPFVTVHKRTGALAVSNFWYEGWVGGPESKPNLATTEKWNRDFIQLNAALGRSKWIDNCRLALVSYFKAFSNPNLEESFLDGWRLLEKICGHNGQKSDDLIRRASNVFRDDTYARSVGKHLRFRRNSISHGNPIREDNHENLAFEVRNFTAPVLYHFVMNPMKLEKIDDFWEFLDISSNKQERDREVARIKRRLNLLEKVDHFRRDIGSKKTW